MTVSAYSGAEPTTIPTTLVHTATGLTLNGMWTAKRVMTSSDVVVLNVNIVYKSVAGTTGGSGAFYAPAQLRIIP